MVNYSKQEWVDEDYYVMVKDRYLSAYGMISTSFTMLESRALYFSDYDQAKKLANEFDGRVFIRRTTTIIERDEVVNA